MSKQQQFLSYAHAFLVAADGHARAAKAKGVDGEVDGMMCIIALQNSVVGAIRTLGQGNHEVQKYKLVAGDLKDVRDMLTHFDEYALGEGKLQEKIAVSEPGAEEVDEVLEELPDFFGWMPMWNSDETMMILNRRKGEVEATVYEVPIHEALKNVAILVSAAAKSIGKKPSALLEKLTETDDGSS